MLSYKFHLLTTQKDKNKHINLKRKQMRKNKYNLQLKNNKLIPLKFKEGKVFLYLQLRYLHQVGYSI
jgi:hypothetical protein